MALPLSPPLLPQLARPAKKLPTGDGWVYEPKWDGFRALAFVDGADVYLQSRSGKPLRRYFPELSFPAGPLRARRGDRALRRRRPAGLRRARPAHPPRRVADQHARRADADALHRVRPARATATSRCSTCRSPSAATRLEAMIAAPLDLTPCTESPDEAQPWLQGAEGVIAKRQDAPLQARRARRHVQDQARPHDRRRRHGLAPGQGGGHRRLADPRPARRPTASCASSATPPASRPPRSASCPPSSPPTRPASAAWATRRAGTTSASSSGSRMRPELVVEVTFDHTSNDRIRHGTKILRWREDKKPSECRWSSSRADRTWQHGRRMPIPERPVLVAPDSFKGTFSAAQVAGAIGRGIERAGLMPPDLCPVADGGEGTLDALLPQLGGELLAVTVRGPLGGRCGPASGSSRTGARRSSRWRWRAGSALMPRSRTPGTPRPTAPAS